MRREIYEVTAKIVDANGNLATLDGYPKTFDSKLYDNDISKTLNRAKSAFHEVISPMYKRDDRQLQIASIVRLNTAELIVKEVIGKIADLPDPEEDGEEGE